MQSGGATGSAPIAKRRARTPVRALSGAELAQALAEQHGVELAAQDGAELETVLRPATEAEPTYSVFEVIFEPGYQRRTELFESSNFLETADHAFEFVAEHDPAALEIHRTHGAAQETVWNYSASRAAAVNADRKELVETFGFDPGLYASYRLAGASGARLVGTTALELARRGGRYGLATMCIGVGQGIAMVIERV